MFPRHIFLIRDKTKMHGYKYKTGCSISLRIFKKRHVSKCKEGGESNRENDPQEQSSQIGLSLPGLAIITRRPLASRPGAANRYLQNMIIHLCHTCVLPVSSIVLPQRQQLLHRWFRDVQIVEGRMVDLAQQQVSLDRFLRHWDVKFFTP